MDSLKHRHVQLHRFHDRAALYIGPQGRETVYLSPEDARRIAELLLAGAGSCESEPFGKSTFHTHEFEVVA